MSSGGGGSTLSPASPTTSTIGGLPAAGVGRCVEALDAGALDMLDNANNIKRFQWVPVRNVVLAASQLHIWRSTNFSFSSAMASAGLRLLGQALAQFKMVWQR